MRTQLIDKYIISPLSKLRIAMRDSRHRHIKEQRAFMKTGLYIQRACALTSDSLPVFKHYAPSADAMWTDSMLVVPCAGNALHAVVVLCNSSMHLTVPVYSRGIFRAVLAVVFELEPLTAKCAGSADWESTRSGGMWRHCLTPLVTHSLFHQHLRHLIRGQCI